MDNLEKINDIEAIEPATESSEEKASEPQIIYVDENNSRVPLWLKTILIIIAAFAVIALLVVGCTKSVGSVAEKMVNYSSLLSSTEAVKVEDVTGKYIGTIHIEAEIDENGKSRGYNHNYIINSINSMMNDDDNLGIIIYMNTPGGSVYASDDIYLKICEYQNKTGRPVYSSMQSQATSGGYYISAPCDKIYANRNCWTGSIGVTLGTMYDVSELLDNLGIRVQTITSGENKAMGSTTQEMTNEQRDILQSLVDEAYEQFVGIVADGRGMDIQEVKEIADGRIYSARQAKEIGLVDEIGTYGDCANAILDLVATSNIPKDSIKVIELYPAKKSQFEEFLGVMSEKIGSKYSASDIEELMDLNGKFTISYEAEIQK